MTPDGIQLRLTGEPERLLAALIAQEAAAAAPALSRPPALGALQARIAQRIAQTTQDTGVSPFDRMQHCRDSLTYLDTCGWQRSYHQRLFHEDFLVGHLLRASSRKSCSDFLSSSCVSKPFSFCHF